MSENVLILQAALWPDGPIDSMVDELHLKIGRNCCGRLAEDLHDLLDLLFPVEIWGDVPVRTTHPNVAFLETACGMLLVAGTDDPMAEGTTDTFVALNSLIANGILDDPLGPQDAIV